MTIFQYSKWVAETDVTPILDFTMTFPSIPNWLIPYSTAPNGCVHRIFATMKLKGSQSNYEGFTRDLRLMLSELQCHSLEKVFFYLLKSCLLNVRLYFCRKSEALILWNKRCAPMSVARKPLVFHFAHIECRSTRVVKCVNFCLPNFQSFSTSDLTRLKNNNEWLSDSHVTFSLQFVDFSIALSLSQWKQGLFSRLWGEKYMGKSEDPAFWHHILDTAI